LPYSSTDNFKLATRWGERGRLFENVNAFFQFPDPEHGEWYGYLTREGKKNQTFKGGPYKGALAAFQVRSHNPGL